jgi:hypothetical protein
MQEAEGAAGGLVFHVPSVLPCCSLLTLPMSNNHVQPGCCRHAMP